MAEVPGLVVGATLGAVDAFLVEKVAGGWRPNQFVDGPLRGFVDGKQDSGGKNES
ncbi:MAG: hypothetical protein V2A79_02615 [Planctomycetota bacterium]